MISALHSVKRLMKMDNVCVDNNVFKLHYKVTALLLLACSFLLSTRQYFGSAMYCTVNGIPIDDADANCWSHSTFTVISSADDQLDTDIGLSEIVSRIYGRDLDKVEYHSYYHWMFLVLFAQAVLFCVPRFVWKLWESGRIRTIMFDLDSPINTDAYKSERKKMLVEYFATNMHTHNLYAIRFFMCELMNTTNVVIQMLCIDYCFNGQFSTYGPDMFWMSGMEPERRYDPADELFPRITKCTFHTFSRIGTVQKLEGVCVLPLNIINQKIYSFLWPWFMFVSLVSLFNTIYRLAIMTVSQFRLKLLSMRVPMIPRDQLVAICDKCEIGDWFVMYQLSKNIHPVIFTEFVADLLEKLDADDIIAEFIMKLRATKLAKAREALKAREAMGFIENV